VNKPMYEPASFAKPKEKIVKAQKDAQSISDAIRDGGDLRTGIICLANVVSNLSRALSGVQQDGLTEADVQNEGRSSMGVQDVS